MHYHCQYKRPQACCHYPPALHLVTEFVNQNITRLALEAFSSEALGAVLRSVFVQLASQKLLYSLFGLIPVASTAFQAPLFVLLEALVDRKVEFTVLILKFVLAIADCSVFFILHELAVTSM